MPKVSTKLAKRPAWEEVTNRSVLPLFEWCGSTLPCIMVAVLAYLMATRALCDISAFFDKATGLS